MIIFFNELGGRPLINCCQSQSKKTIRYRWLFIHLFYYYFSLFSTKELREYFDIWFFLRWDSFLFFFIIYLRKNSHSFSVLEIWYDREFIVCVLFVSLYVVLLVGDFFYSFSTFSMQYVCNTNYYYRQIKIWMTYQHTEPWL